MRRTEFIRLREFMKTRIQEQIMMNVWSEHHKGPRCMTAGCVGGWATHLFHEQGLTLEMTALGDGFTLYYDGRYGYAAFAKFFDVSYGTALLLCNPASYPHPPTKNEILSRMNKVINGPETNFIENNGPIRCPLLNNRLV